MTGPLSDIRVLDIATFLAAPFCGTMLGDFGAEVIKIEQPDAGDSLRRFGTMTECGDTLIWLSEARNKRSVTLDLRQPEGAELFRQLVSQSNVVLENFRPGTLDRWGLGFDDLLKINPKLVMLSVSGYGQTGPKKNMPGFARIAHAFSGLAYLSGEPGRPPVVPGSTSLADYMSGMIGAFGVMVALRHADKTGEGQQIDIALYESIFRVLDELAPAYARSGFRREPMGPDTINVVPHSHYETSDGQWIALACSNDRMWQRLVSAMGCPDLSADANFSTMTARNERRSEVNTIVSTWVKGRSLLDILAVCEREQVPCSKLLSIEDIFSDSHYAARKNMINHDDPRVGSITLPSPIPQMSKTPPVFRHAGPSLGEANFEILGEMLGLDEQTLAQLKSGGVI